MSVQETISLVPAAETSRTWSVSTSFVLVVAAQVLLFTGSNLPTPLFPIYEQHYRFGSGVVTLLFAAYVGVLVPALVLLGPVGDRIGRRPLLVTGIAVTTISSVAFAAARNVGWLFAGEIIYGIGSALVMSCVSVAIRELHPRRDVASASIVASIAIAAGLTLGPLVGGLLAATPWPTTAPYALDVLLAAALAAALTRIPETRPAPTNETARPTVIHVPAELRHDFIGPATAGALSFMMVGWVFALSPSFLHEALGVDVSKPVVGGLFVALVMLCAGASQLVFRRQIVPHATTLGLWAVVIGFGTIAASSLVTSLAVAVVGGVIAGTGAGVVQMNAMTAVQRIAPVHIRGSVVSAYVTLCYVALSVPVIAAGVAADRFGLATVTGWYSVALAVLVGSVLLRSRRRAGSRAPGSHQTTRSQEERHAHTQLQLHAVARRFVEPQLDR
jgi:MFS family permease